MIWSSYLDWNGEDMLLLLLSCSSDSTISATAISTHCWDLNGDGERDEDEDRNSDGVWDASDCQGSSGGIEKGMIYAVYGSSGSYSSAVCDDNDDVMLNGGCDFEESCIPAEHKNYPLYNDDESQPAEWYCALNCGFAIASGFCLTVDGP